MVVVEGTAAAAVPTSRRRVVIVNRGQPQHHAKQKPGKLTLGTVSSVNLARDSFELNCSPGMTQIRNNCETDRCLVSPAVAAHGTLRVGVYQPLHALRLFALSMSAFCHLKAC